MSMNVDSAEVADEPGWDVDPADEVVAVAVAVGRQVKAWREAAGLTAAELAQLRAMARTSSTRSRGGSGSLGRSSWTGRTRFLALAGRSRR